MEREETACFVQSNKASYGRLQQMRERRKHCHNYHCLLIKGKAIPVVALLLNAKLDSILI